MGPPIGVRMAIFVDDLNMPKKETYGAQPPIELVRQWMDHSGWYERKSKEKTWVKVEDIVFVSAMGPPGGGRSTITMRLKRHFNIITYTNIAKDSIDVMFKTVLNHFLSNFESNILDEINHIVEATQNVYELVGD